MSIPYLENIYVNERKITDYLLSEVHSTGKYKANFFINLGFNKNFPVALANELINIAINNKVKETSVNEFGAKYIVDGFLNAPNGKSYLIRTIWILENFNQKPYLITAYPA
jgi:hypothetical protein